MRSLSYFLMITLMMITSGLNAATQAKFSIVPTAETDKTAFLLPINYQETVTYQVTNQTKMTRLLTMVPLPGVSQVITGTGVCGAQFLLAPQASCLLTLNIEGGQVPSQGIVGGPVVCKTKSASNLDPDFLFCSQPSQDNLLSISSTGTLGQHTYILNEVGNSVTRCQFAPDTGRLSRCEVVATGFSNPEALAFNSSGTLVYITNFTGASISMCNVDSASGALSNCVDSGAGPVFVSPDGIAFNPSGTVMYISDAATSRVVTCKVDASSGLLSGCLPHTDPTFNVPGDLAINSSGTNIYVVNFASSTVSICPVDGETVSACTLKTDTLIDGPEGMTINPLGTFGFIANNGSNNVVSCPVEDDGLLGDCHIANLSFDGLGNVAFNQLGSLAFVPRGDLNLVYSCLVNQVEGTLLSCSVTGGSFFDFPSGIALNPILN